ncbi:hypothetical protein GLX30_03490 [Streptomyces sp. Tu 2975]|uniref:hypothetical protein n=1 Tax=Streptomyces sp. Tu 2975 TaxID=2676871 RepID=UPI0013583B1B|nr:hypothetical protein [Streptomyces sp. Tu 2975]QIP83283.1 hypothetical protein GLX30_03490 [Streptomyces sp. Tu 2975]
MLEAFLVRLAARYHLGLRDLLAAITETDGRRSVAGMLHPDSEIHLNAQARARVSVLCRVQAAVLRRVPVRRYLAPEERVRGRHRYWLMFLPGTTGLPVPLGQCPEVVRTQQRHIGCCAATPPRPGPLTSLAPSPDPGGNSPVRTRNSSDRPASGLRVPTTLIPAGGR